jgi:basic membrane protein A
VLVFVFGRPGAGSFNAAAAAAVDAMKSRAEAANVQIELLWRQTFDTASRLAAIETALAGGRAPGLVIVHGGQGDGPVAQLAPRHPSTLFAVTQGSVVGPNLASYEVRQEESAFLAGVFAARTTRTGCVAHLSGEPVRPGRLGRAAFFAGVRDEAPGMRVLTAFCGHQHDPQLALRWASAMIDDGADVMFTMLDGGRPGAIQACRERGVALIGNVEDWTRREPGVCTASAIADSGWGVEQAICDWLDGRFPAGNRISIGAERPGVVRLALAVAQSALHGEAIAARTRRLIAEPHVFSPDFAGQQFTLPDGQS